ncbi:hypothetical protein BD324DRAFT_609331 [Kockovaella imperatae]|uniref:DUF4185 domain-containing protein n=1 Tax=Kockovaella imperatae TaxID=4999 RepID=A0A1Y1UBW3_9TREE|nr:hypothetical protein BD324DRAFT_609331 [Kockovaella imperatae]ORX35531.1 hypothetical protein BD324DRAFT_609331 [Kockovaella imperatae]
MISSIKALLLLTASVSAAPAARNLLTPKLVKTPELKGVALDPNLIRDSCISTYELIDGRVLWLCRDTIILKNQSIPYYFEHGQLFGGGAAGLVSSSASWSDQGLLGPDFVQPPPQQGQKDVTSLYPAQLTQYGGSSIYDQDLAYVPYQPDECDGIPAGTSGGNCNDGTRYALWPDSPPVVTNTALDGTVTMHLYLRVPHTGFLRIVDFYPPCSLFKLTYTPNTDKTVLPSISLVAQDFFPRYVFNYGDFAHAKDPLGQTLYLWAQSFQGNYGLARVPVNAVEDLSQYEYYYSNGTGWSSVQPNVNQTEAYVDIGGLGASGQATIYWNPFFGQYVAFGQLEGEFVANLYMSLASNPEGPWSDATLVYSFPTGPSGNGYTLAAHPEMSLLPNEIYISYTGSSDYNNNTNDQVYNTPIYKLTFGLGL